jgi:hypothetical protein
MSPLTVSASISGRNVDAALLRYLHRDVARSSAAAAALATYRFYLDHDGVAFALEDELLDFFA